MKKFIQTIKNIWSIEELRAKIGFTLMMIAIYVLGTKIVLPGIDPARITEAAGNTGAGGVLDLINTFSGGAFNQQSIFALGIMPYISASIFMQLMTVLVPRFQKMQKEGESGRKKINQYTRYLTVAVTLLQASAYVTYLNGINANTGAMIASFKPYFWLSSVVVLTAGTMFVMWMGEKITDKGLGNGTSLITRRPLVIDVGAAGRGISWTSSRRCSARPGSPTPRWSCTGLAWSPRPATISGTAPKRTTSTTS